MWIMAFLDSIVSNIIKLCTCVCETYVQLFMVSNYLWYDWVCQEIKGFFRLTFNNCEFFIYPIRIRVPIFDCISSQTKREREGLDVFIKMIVILNFPDVVCRRYCSFQRPPFCRFVVYFYSLRYILFVSFGNFCYVLNIFGLHKQFFT